MSSKRISGSLSGAAGVHFVSGELSRLGYIALQTVKNTKGIDIVVPDFDFTKTAYLQVKTFHFHFTFGNPMRKNTATSGSNSFPRKRKLEN
jgi:hypothetical protein